jgi:hypothetical protein
MLEDECVNNCFMFKTEKDCVEDHCAWDESGCFLKNCYNKNTKDECNNDSLCFWLEKNEDTPKIQCIDKV